MRAARLALLVALIASVVAAAAPNRAQAQDPAPPPAPHAWTIGVYGDSLGDGVWSGLYYVLKAHPEMRLIRRSKVGAGLTRGDYQAWLSEFRAQLDADPLSAAVVMYGGNDQQSLRDETHKGYLFETPGWRTVYAGRVHALLEEFAKRNVKVVWVGLPVMGRESLNAGATYLNGIFAEEAKATGATFLPLFDQFRGDDGDYAAWLPDAQKRSRQVRQDDGVHFTGYGYELLADKVFAQLQSLRLASASVAQTR